MAESRSILAFGKFRRDQRTAMAVAAGQSHFELHTAESPREVNEWLNTHEANAILIDGEEADQVAIETRSQSRHALVPMMALSRDLGDLSFEEAFSWGADDVIGLGRVRPLMSRLRALPQATQVRPGDERGTALVIEHDQTRRVALGRVLRNAGYTVSFAISAQDAGDLIRSQNPALVVLNTELDDSPRARIEEAQGHGCDGTWVITCPPRELRKFREALQGLAKTTAADGYTPPENVLFLANEMRGLGATNQRESPRILYGTTVGFRGAGRREDDFGFTYNVSATGLYVRTLVPPEDEYAWLELCPPRGQRWVRLVGRVAWRRSFGRGEFATVPPGFGVQIVDGAKADLAIWAASYEQLAADLG